MNPRIMMTWSSVLRSSAVLAAFLVIACSEEVPGWSSEKEYLAAKQLYDDGNYTDAEAAFAAFVTDYPEGERADDATYFRGLSLYHLEDFLSALDQFDALTASYPESNYADQALYYGGRCAYKLAAFDAAVLRFTAYVARYVDGGLYDDATYYLGRSLVEIGNPSEALAAFETLLETPTSVYMDSALYWAGRVEYDLGRASVPVSVSDLSSSRTYFESLFTEFPGTVYEDNARYYYAMCSYAMADWPSALDELQYIIDTFRDSIYFDNAWYYKAYTLYKSGDYTAAATELGAFLAQVSGSNYEDNAVYISGRTQYQIGYALSGGTAAYQSAVDFFERVINDYPDSNYVDNAFYYEIKALIRIQDCAGATEKLIQFEQLMPSGDYFVKATDYAALNC